MASLRQILGRAQSPSEEKTAKRKKGMSSSSFAKEEELEGIKEAVSEQEVPEHPSDPDAMETSTVVTSGTTLTRDSSSIGTSSDLCNMCLIDCPCYK